MSLRIELPYLPPAAYSGNDRSHWSARRGRYGANHAVLADVRVLVREQGWKGPALQQARVEVEFVLPDRRRRDPGSLQERVKPLFDALVRTGVLADDDLATIGFPQYTYRYQKGQAQTIITVCPATRREIW